MQYYFKSYNFNDSKFRKIGVFRVFSAHTWRKLFSDHEIYNNLFKIKIANRRLCCTLNYEREKKKYIYNHLVCFTKIII